MLTLILNNVWELKTLPCISRFSLTSVADWFTVLNSTWNAPFLERFEEDNEAFEPRCCGMETREPPYDGLFFVWWVLFLDLFFGCVLELLSGFLEFSEFPLNWLIFCFLFIMYLHSPLYNTCLHCYILLCSYYVVIWLLCVCFLYVLLPPQKTQVFDLGFPYFDFKIDQDMPLVDMVNR